MFSGFQRLASGVEVQVTGSLLHSATFEKVYPAKFYE